MTDSKKRSVSSARLETLRKAKELSVGELIDELKAFQIANPQHTTYNTVTTAWADANRLRAVGGSSSASDVIKQKIKSAFEQFTFGEVKGVRMSPKNHDKYNVTVQTKAGPEQKMWVVINEETSTMSYGIDNMELGSAPYNAASTTSTAPAQEAQPQTEQVEEQVPATAQVGDDDLF